MTTDSIKNKIDHINKLEKRVSELEQFYILCDKGDAETEYKDDKRQPRFNRFSKMSIGSYRWTGTQDPELVKTITNEDDISLVIRTLKQTIYIQIEKLKAELESKLV